MSHLDELLSTYLDGESTPAESRRVALHVGECLRCRRRLARLHEARAAVRSLPLLELPAELLASSRPESQSTRRRPLWLGVAAAAAAAVMVVTATFNTSQPEPIDLSDLSRQIGARAALESGAGSIKVVMPGGVGE